MEFHDVLHGLIRFSDESLMPLLSELIDSPEVHRLRNMRQMNFDVPLIQELGRSRRFPHSIGVAHLAIKLAYKSQLDLNQKKTLLAAAILHDAAIPPYGHLVESEFKIKSPGFNHESRVKDLISGDIDKRNIYMEVVPGRQLKVHSILEKFNIKQQEVFDLICPEKNERTAISADIDIDNIDNIHRMAAMLGWQGVKENLESLIDCINIKNRGGLEFTSDCIGPLNQWLQYRQKIYTMIIAHPECIPYNAFQTDMIRAAVKNKIIKPEEWWLTEPVFEDRLRKEKATSVLAEQLISGCEYHLIDYVWIKNFITKKKLHNSFITLKISEEFNYSEAEYGYFVWNEKGLISRELLAPGNENNYKLGYDSTSCMIALVKKTPGKPKRTKHEVAQWRQKVISIFKNIFEVDYFEVDFPEDYTGNFLDHRNNELQLGYY